MNNQLLPFDLETALKHPKRVVYRNGEKPLEWHYFEYKNTIFATHPLCGFLTHNRDGKYFSTVVHQHDLLLLPPPEKRYWVNVYEDKTGCLVTGKICESEEECNKRLDIMLPIIFIKTITFTI